MREARRLGDRLTRLARVTAALVMADTVETVTKIVASHTADAVGATLASLALREGEDLLRLVGLRGGREGDERRWATFPMSLQEPGQRRDPHRRAAHPHRRGRDRRALSRPRRPSPAESARSSACRCGSARARSARSGCRSRATRILDAAELEFLEIMADTCAQALERITAQEAAATQTAKLVFLADASTELASSLDYQATLARVARLAVPTFADWCAIDVVEDGRLHRLAVAHVDPAKVELALALQERYPPDPDAPTGRGR